MRKFWNFLQYHNAVPIGLSILFGASGIALAATPEVQQAVYATHDEVKGVDNSYLISADLSHYDFALKITDVKEDTDNYYVSYTYKTINVIDYVWQQTDVAKTMTLSKKEVEGHDLGVMVQDQLGQEITSELAYLTEAQEKEREAGDSVRTVATTYSGLVGQMFDPTTKEFPSYVPVVKDESPIPPDLAAAIVGDPDPGTTRIALPPIPTQSDIAQLVADAVNNALANAQTTQPASSTAAATPPPDTNPPPAATPPPDNTSSPVTAPPPADVTPPDNTPPATSTPPVVTPPADTTPPATSTPPVVTPPADTAPASTTPPATPDPTPAPAPDTGSSTPAS